MSPASKIQAHVLREAERCSKPREEGFGASEEGRDSLLQELMTAGAHDGSLTPSCRRCSCRRCSSSFLWIFPNFMQRIGQQIGSSLHKFLAHLLREAERCPKILRKECLGAAEESLGTLLQELITARSFSCALVVSSVLACTME